ncbi:protein of unknown function [Spirosomataceae bacterium TFI 002]|nr:protein of unknown function [Spirosomataceae bacterium TFI 002]
MNTTLSKKIIFDYFDGKNTTLQQKMIEDWLKVEENQELFFQYLDEWESEHPQYFFDSDKGSLKISARIKKSEGDDISLTTDSSEVTRRFHFNYTWLAAAVLLISTWFGIKEFTKTEKVSYVELVSNAKKQTGEIYEKENLGPEPLFVLLPDNSSVLLQPGSKISYSLQKYNQSKRDVILSGEAFFEVQKNQDIPFFVFANNLITKVIGTSFTVKTNDSETEVIVKTGRVSVIMQNDKDKFKKIDGNDLKGLVLSANEQVIINNNSEKIEKKAFVVPAELLQPIQSISFDFDETPAIEILEVLKSAYNIDITYNKEKLRNCKLTAHLSDEPLIEKIKLICIALEADYEENENNFVIHSNGCN